MSGSAALERIPLASDGQLTSLFVQQGSTLAYSRSRCGSGAGSRDAGVPFVVVSVSSPDPLRLFAFPEPLEVSPRLL